ncbi:MAG: hypothetical protein HY540_02105 [Deltaproteobacteria bacterium]|nr:hypothetical protein [Deltaproteobacteria bacterium]
MKKILLSFIALLLILKAFPSHACGIVLDVKGDVRVTRDGKSSPVKFGEWVRHDSTVSTSKTGTISFLEEDTIVTIGPDQHFTMGKALPPALQRLEIEGLKLVLLDASEATSQKSSTAKMALPPTGKGGSIAASASMFGVQGLFPLHTVIDPVETLIFRWFYTKPATWTPSVIIEQSDQQKLAILPQVRKATKASVLAADVGAKPGREMFWYVAEWLSNGTINMKTPRYRFRFLATEDAERLARDLKALTALKLPARAMRILESQLYYKYGMLQKMIDTLRPLHAKGAGSAVKDLLYFGYLRIGLIREMEKYR